jgi:hypothetical protein
MESTLLSSESKSDMRVLIELAKKLGMKVKQLTEQEIEDWVLARRIETGLKSGTASREQVMQVLDK